MKRAILLSIDEDFEEMHALLHTLDVKVEREVVQRRQEPHRNAFLGPGKIEELKKEITSIDVDYVVINGNLRPSQHHTLEMSFQKECLDRVGVILRIFAERAQTEEAKDQVTLATLRYELPFLREWIHKAKSGERPGFLSGGAYATDVYFEHAKSHIKRIEARLRNHSQQREIRRLRRRKRGFFLVSFAGYTNAGKSALLNALSDSEELVDDQLFSTLSTATRSLKGTRRNILLTDTVGFIRNLPPDLIDAFNSTLEEIFLADLILLIVDTSEPLEIVNVKLKTSLEILLPKLDGGSMMIVGTKLDKVPVANRAAIQDVFQSAYPTTVAPLVSALTHEGLEGLIAVIETAENRSIAIEVRLPITDSAMSLLSELHDTMPVEKTEINDSIQLMMMCRPDEVAKISGRVRVVKGTVTIVK